MTFNLAALRSTCGDARIGNDHIKSACFEPCIHFAEALAYQGTEVDCFFIYRNRSAGSLCSLKEFLGQNLQAFGLFVENRTAFRNAFSVYGAFGLSSPSFFKRSI